MLEPINLAHKFSRFHEQWSPKVVAEMNDTQVKLAKIEGEFVWHQHDDTDETFLVVKGEMQIDLPGDEVTLCAGELYVVPRGVRHRTRAAAECHVLILAPRGTVNTGESGGDLTAPDDVWI